MDLRDTDLTKAILPRSLDDLDRSLQFIVKEHLTWIDSLGKQGMRVDFSRYDLSDLKLNNINRSEEHTSELQSLMRISYAVFCLKKKKQNTKIKQLQKANMIINIYRQLTRH